MKVQRGMCCQMSNEKRAPASTFKGVPNGSQRVSIHHPLGFNWHPFEGAGGCLGYLGG